MHPLAWMHLAWCYEVRTCSFCARWDGMGWDGMGWDEVGWRKREREGACVSAACRAEEKRAVRYAVGAVQ